MVSDKAVESKSPNDSETLVGRERLIDFIWSELLERPRNDRRQLPVVALLGSRGSGKTMVLDHLAAECRLQAAQPFVPVYDLAVSREAVGNAWQLVVWLAWQLGAKRWDQFGYLRFPRLTLGRIVLMGAVSTPDLDQTKKNIQSLLKRAVQPGELTTAAADVLLGQVPQLLGLPSWAGDLGRVGARVSARWLMERLRFHSGLEFYARALQDKVNGGLNALMEISEMASTDVARVNLVLCEAFLADLTEEYKHGFRPRNCLVLLDNLDDSAGLGKSFLTALTGAKANHARGGMTAPLVVVAASRRASAVVSRPRSGDGDPAAAGSRFCPDTMVSRDEWQASGGRTGTWVYPVRLTDLAKTGIESLASDYPGTESWIGFVRSLTRGHPWGTREVLKAVRAATKALQPGQSLEQHHLRKILDQSALGDKAVKYLLTGDLPHPLPAAMPSVAAGLDLGAATSAGLVGRALLKTELADLLWLDGPDGSAITELHRWPRRLLLRSLAQPDRTSGLSWQKTYEKLGELPPGKPTEAYHYGLARGEFTPAVDWLTRGFVDIGRSGQVTAAEWIADFNTITVAGQEHIDYPDARQRHGTLVHGLRKANDLDQAYEVPPASQDEAGKASEAAARATRELRTGFPWPTILVMVVARWIWADPLGDPTLTLNPVLASGFRELAMGSAGEWELIAEAEFYESGGRP